MSGRKKARVALITGNAGGIGFAGDGRFARDGAAVPFATIAFAPAVEVSP